LFLSSDNWRFVERGIPAYLITSEHPDGTPAYGPSNGIVVTPADTLDKLDPRNLREHAIVETDLLLRLAAADRELPRRSSAEIDAQLEDEDKTYKAELYSNFEY